MQPHFLLHYNLGFFTPTALHNQFALVLPRMATGIGGKGVQDFPNTAWYKYAGNFARVDKPSVRRPLHGPHLHPTDLSHHQLTLFGMMEYPRAPVTSMTHPHKRPNPTLNQRLWLKPYVTCAIIPEDKPDEMGI